MLKKKKTDRFLINLTNIQLKPLRPFDSFAVTHIFGAFMPFFTKSCK